MKVFDYDDMPDDELRSWLGYIKADIQSSTSFRNVTALKIGAINTALKRLDELRLTTEPVVAENKSVREIMDGIGS